MLFLDFVVIVVAAIPAIGVAGFVSGVNSAGILPVLAVQIGTGLLAMGVIGCRSVVMPTVMTGVLAMFAVVMPVVGYAWSDFFPAAAQNGWGYFPMEALASALSGGQAAAYGYALGAGVIGIFLVATLGGENRGRRGLQ